MKKLIISLLFIANLPIYGQETKVMNLCYMGHDKIKIYLEYVDKEYIMHTYFMMQEGFFINKGSDFTIITVENDSIHLVGLDEGNSRSLAGKQNQPPGIILWGFNNRYQIYPEQLKLLRSKEIKTVTVDLATRKIKMDLQSFLMDTLIILIEKLEKKIK